MTEEPPALASFGRKEYLRAVGKDWLDVRHVGNLKDEADRDIRAILDYQLTGTSFGQEWLSLRQVEHGQDAALL